MNVFIYRGKPVNRIVEVNPAQVKVAEPHARGGRLTLVGGDVLAFNRDEWRQWELQTRVGTESEPVVHVRKERLVDRVIKKVKSKGRSKK